MTLTVTPGPLGWGWVPLSEVAAYVGATTPLEVLERYLHSSKDVYTISVLSGEGALLHVHLSPPWCPHGEWDWGPADALQDHSALYAVIQRAYVPAGWAQDVVRLHDAGVLRVELVSVRGHYSPSELDDYRDAQGGTDPVQDALQGCLDFHVLDRDGLFHAGRPIYARP